MKKDYLQKLAHVVMEEFGETNFPEMRAFSIHHAREEAEADGAGSFPEEEWWIEFLCTQCTSGLMPRLVIIMAYDVKDEDVQNEMRGYIKAHISENHAA